MPQHQCPHCRGAMQLTKRLTFPDGGIKLIYECGLCERARIEARDAEGAPTEAP